MNHDDAMRGGCQCGAVRFHAGKLGRASLCQCPMCRKAFASIGCLASIVSRQHPDRDTAARPLPETEL